MSARRVRVKRSTTAGTPTSVSDARGTKKQKDTQQSQRLPETRLRAFRVGEGLPSVSALVHELDGYLEVLLGRCDPPDPIKGSHIDALMEYASTVHARGMEIELMLHKLEREGHITRGSQLYKFRTGELRTFNEIAKRASDLGSRRVTVEQMVLSKTYSDPF